MYSNNNQIEIQNYWRELAFQQPLKSRDKPQVYFDIEIGNQAAGRIVFELFTDLTPITSENFRGLCTGEYGSVGIQGRTKELHYIDSGFHKIVENFVVQGGDIIQNDGTGVI